MQFGSALLIPSFLSCLEILVQLVGTPPLGRAHGRICQAAAVEYTSFRHFRSELFEENSNDTENMEGIDLCSTNRCVNSFGMQQEGGTGDTTIAATAGDSDSNSGRKPCSDPAGPDHNTDLANRQRERHQY